MKKFISLLCAGVLVLTSCSSDKNDTTPVTPAKVILPSKAIETSEGGTPFTSLIIYNGDKIGRISNDGGDITYTYTGDLITKIVESASKKDKDFLGSTTDYVYENNKLKTSTTTGVSSTRTSKSKVDYTHSADGTVDYKFYSIDNITGSERLGGIAKFTYLNGNIIKIERGSSTTIIVYDTKNNPLKNIKGFDKLIDEGGSITVNNVTKETRTSSGSTVPIVTAYEYIYNTDGYPTQVKQFIDGKLERTIQYFY